MDQAVGDLQYKRRMGILHDDGQVPSVTTSLHVGECLLAAFAVGQLTLSSWRSWTSLGRDLSAFARWRITMASHSWAQPDLDTEGLVARWEQLRQRHKQDWKFFSSQQEDRPRTAPPGPDSAPAFRTLPHPNEVYALWPPAEDSLPRGFSRESNRQAPLDLLQTVTIELTDNPAEMARELIN
jgi:hypothetical protein